MEWISVKDKLPKFEKIVLFTDGKDTAMGYLHSTIKKGNVYCVVYGDMWEHDVQWKHPLKTTYVYDILESVYIRGVTHWMLLPDPPITKNIEKEQYETEKRKAESE